MQNNTNTKTGTYLVGLMDILGQKNLLNKIERLQVNQNYNELEESFKRIIDFRTVFVELFEQVRKINTDFLNNNNITPLNSHDIHTQSFSDTVITFMQLDLSDTAQVPCLGIFCSFLIAAYSFLNNLAQGFPIRGGIDIGLCLENKTNETYEIYGPALSRSYELESKIAQYPRILIGDNLLKYLTKKNNITKNDNSSKLQKNFASECLKCLREDCDGNKQIDYLGSHIKQSLGTEILDNNNFTTMLKNAYNIVDDTVIKFQQNDDKLYYRYKILKKYFDDSRPNYIELLAK